MAHRQRYVVFIIKCARHEGDCPAGHEFLDEGDGTPLGASVAAFDVEAQVDFSEIAVEWNRKAQHARVEEHETHEADQRAPLPQIQLGARRHTPRENRRIDLVIEHGEIAPFGGEENAGHQANNSLTGKRQPGTAGSASAISPWWKIAGLSKVSGVYLRINFSRW